MKIRDFYLRKKVILEKLKQALDEGEVDEPIIDLLNLINSHSDYVTTSSCAGRIVLMKIPETGKKCDADFLYKTHHSADHKVLWSKLSEVVKSISDPIWFKMEPVILHVDCRTLEAASKIVDLARESGWKRSGIFLVRPHRIMVELHSTERIDTIVAKNGEILITEKYMEILVEEANKKLRKTREKMKRFYILFRDNLLSDSFCSQ